MWPWLNSLVPFKTRSVHHLAGVPDLVPEQEPSNVVRMRGFCTAIMFNA
jgi:hypothetical protein